MYQLLSFPQRRMWVTTAHRGCRNTSCISTRTHIPSLYVLQVLKKTQKPTALCELESTSSQMWRYWLSRGVQNFCCIKWIYLGDLPQSPTDKDHGMKHVLHLLPYYYNNAFLNLWLWRLLLYGTSSYWLLWWGEKASPRLCDSGNSQRDSCITTYPSKIHVFQCFLRNIWAHLPFGFKPPVYLSVPVKNRTNQFRDLLQWYADYKKAQVRPQCEHLTRGKLPSIWSALLPHSHVAPFLRNSIVAVDMIL